MRYDEVYQKGVQKLKDGGIAEAKLEAAIFLEEVCHTSRSDLYAHPEREVSEEEYNNYVNYLKIRLTRKPLQAIIGKQNFMGMEFYVNPSTLIPRQDTEFLVECVLEELHDGMHILDLCTGSGCILISLMRYSNHCGGVGTDISEEALTAAVENAERLLQKDPENGQFDDVAVSLEEALKPTTEDSVQFLCTDLFTDLPDKEKFDIIVSNPPYIATAEIAKLEPEVKDYDPIAALDGGESGLDFYERIIDEAGNHLVKGGWIYFEIGYDQGEAVKEMLIAKGFCDVEVRKDYAGRDRVALGRY
ncbi:MAG: peptide chain release factor N(5)-glutamine methyltransferase [Lachnospiraceae bacterium]|nr:peptide chain release factor N(5)-glutamine methyltransferase [Lachnospiraceae bacterium]